MLRSVGTAEASQLLKSVFSSMQSIVFSADLYMEIGRDLCVFPIDDESRRETPVVDRSAFDNLGQILVGKIVQASRDGELAKAPYFWNVLRVWMHFDKTGEPETWLHRWMMDDASFMLRVAHGLVGVSHSTKGKSYRFTDSADADLYDFDDICRAVREHLRSAKLTDDERHLLNTVLDGATKFQCKQETNNSEHA